MTTTDPDACPRCGGTELVRVPDTLQPGEWIAISCPLCSAYAQRVQGMLDDLHVAMTQKPTLPRERPQSSAEIARDMALEQRAEERKAGRVVSGREADWRADVYYGRVGA